MQDKVDSGDAFHTPQMIPISQVLPAGEGQREWWHAQPLPPAAPPAQGAAPILVSAPGGKLYNLEHVVAQALGVQNTRNWIQQHRADLQALLASQYTLQGPPGWGQGDDTPAQPSLMDPMQGEALLQALRQAPPLQPPTDTAGHPPELPLQATPQNLANTLWALAKLKFNKHPVLAALAANLCERQADLSPREVANCAWACGQLHLQHGPLMDALLAQINTLLGEEARGAAHFDAQHISQIASCLQTAAGRGELQAVQRGIVQVCLQRRGALALRELCNVVQGLAQSNFVDDELMEYVAGRVCALRDPLEELHVLDMCTLLQAIATQKKFRMQPWYHRGLFDLLASYLHAHMGALSERQKANAVWALGTAGHYERGLFTDLLQGVAGNMGEADGLFCATQVVQGLGKLGEVPCARAMAGIKGALMESLDTWPHTMVPIVLANLAILGELGDREVEAIYNELLARAQGKARCQVGGGARAEAFDLNPIGFAQLYQAHMIVDVLQGRRLLPAVLVRRGRDAWKQVACAHSVSALQTDVVEAVRKLGLQHVQCHEEFMAQDGLFSMDLALLCKQPAGS